MDNSSQETLRRVQQNDDTLTGLYLGKWSITSNDPRGRFNSYNGSDYSKLGAAIGESTNLTKLDVDLSSDGIALDVIHTGFYDGLKQNKSIKLFHLDCGGYISYGGVVAEILKAYQENNNLTRLNINDADLQNGGENTIATTLRMCTNLYEINIYFCNITDEQIMPMIDAIRGHRSLKKLILHSNSIGSAGCEVLSRLLHDPNCNLHTLDLRANRINNDGATTLANALLNNTKLRNINLRGNPINQSVVGNFNNLLCNMTSINSIYSSNHTLEKLWLPLLSQQNLDSLLKLNEGTNKSHVAIKKIIQYQPNIDMEPLFEWNMEGEGERDLKALPYAVAWFNTARGAVAGNEGGESYNNDAKKLSAVYQFAKAMPLLFVPAPHIKGENNKRKRDDK